MADENNRVAPSGAAPSKDAPGADVSRWIKNLGALVGVFAALAGIWLSVNQLKQKSEADKATATATLDAEKTKLQIAELQLKEQQVNAEAQAKQHREDNKLDYDRHLLDVKRQEAAVASQEASANRTSLAGLIAHVFGSEVSSEGDLAVLFNYVDRDAESKEIVENAVLARLENPRSREEIDLGFRLLERIGPQAIDSTAQANRSARRKVDDYLFSRFYEQAISHNNATALLT